MYIFTFVPFTNHIYWTLPPNKDNMAQSLAALGRPRKTRSRFTNFAKTIACFARASLFSLARRFAIDGTRLA